MGAGLDKLSSVSSNSPLYLQELSGYAVKESIQTKNSRFLRTVECVCPEGQVLVKVYARRGEPLELLQRERSRLEQTAGTFEMVQNSHLLPFAKVIVNERAAFLVRQYLAHNLYERLGTRPFMTDLEKRWILFQLLHAIDQCHHWGIAHGDITTENVLLTSWSWVYLSDFSPFKPAHLPLDDPSDFTFFFNSSGRTAYIAPERFYSLSAGGSSASSASRPEHMSCSDLPQSADMFSFGCVAAELFLASERPLFDFSQLLAYRKGEYNLEEVLQTIKDPWIQELVRNCTKLDPQARISAKEALDQWPDKAFAPLREYIGDRLMRVGPDKRVQTFALDFDALDQLCRVPGSKDSVVWPSVRRTGPPEDEWRSSPFRRTVVAVQTDEEGTGSFAKPVSPDEAIGVLAEAHALLRPLEEQSGKDKPSKKRPTIEATASSLEQKASLLVGAGTLAPAEGAANLDNDDDYSVTESPLSGPLPDFSALRLRTDTDSFILSAEESSLSGDLEDSNANPVMVILLTVLFSSIRHVRSPAVRITALKLLVQFATVLDDEIRLQRIVPFIFALMPQSDDKPLVRATVIRSLEQVLSKVRTGEAQVFGTYIIPRIMGFSKDPDETVREALASCIASLATSARRLAENVIPMNVGFDSALYELRKSFHEMIRDLLEDHSMSVKRRVLMSLTPLCLFFGRRVSTETFVPFVLTFLSHPQWQLRVAAYHHFLGVMSIVGSKSLEDITMALISKSFADQEEFVIDRALSCVVSLVKAGMLRKKVVFDLALLACPLLLHPSNWIRLAALELEQVVWDSLTPADRFVFFCPGLSPFLRSVIPATADSSLIAKLLKLPIERSDLSIALVVAHELYRKGQRMSTQGYSAMLLARLKQNKVRDDALGRILLIAGWMQSHAEGNAAKAVAGGMVEGEAVAEGVVAEGRVAVTERDGTVERPIVLKSVNLVVLDPRGPDVDSEMLTEEEFRRRFMHVSLKPQIASTGVNSLSLSSALDPSALDLSRSDSAIPGTTSAGGALGPGSPLSQSSPSNPLKSSMGASLSVAGSEAGVQLNVSMDSSQDELGPMGPPGVALSINGGLGGGLQSLGGGNELSSKLMQGWRPRGTLVAHLHEHAAAVSQIAVSDDHRFFVSGSKDGTVRVWDCERLHTVVTNRSRLTVKQKGQINSITMIRNTHSVASACDQGTVHIFNIEHQRRVERSFSKTVYTGAQTVRLLDRNEGSIFDIRHQDVGPSSVLMYSTRRGNIHGWDLRMRAAAKESFIMRNPPSLGLTTSVAVDPQNNWLVVGTDLGVYTIWDLRFQIPVRSFSHPTKASVMRLRSAVLYDRTHRNCVFSANADNTVTLWDLEANRARHVCRINAVRGGGGDSKAPLSNMWGYLRPEAVVPSTFILGRAGSERLSTSSSSLFAAPSTTSAPPRASVAFKSVDSVSDLSDLSAVTAGFPREQPAIRSLLAPPDSRFLITGGTDCRIRFWDLNDPSKCEVISGQAMSDQQRATYRQEVHDELSILSEDVSMSQGGASVQGNLASPNGGGVVGGGRSANAGLAMASPSHRDAVTDLNVVYSASTMLLSGDRAGVIKVWL